ncbi:UDP-N-acetyl-D-glucosamine dehydrogenase [Bradyrhizobium brasilense]|uniref:nucleotide sugar dehydrogenase n=1 Tax=Bradyrhizobium brasilense TaxID=1419277 RepID=UPI0009767EEE|nr:nucleotide sugar dehydrogenase [Bradyrhizobium brasilense]OMI12929.1 UDP-N-acetyl-D-glucosamine dehydrogenase [Bradyrhizobium brasilense]
MAQGNDTVREAPRHPAIIQLMDRINSRQAVVGIVGLGYVGLPLALTFVAQRFKVLGFDIDSEKVNSLNAGSSYIRHIASVDISNAVKSALFSATTEYGRLREADAIILCVPTPLTRHREPDLSYVSTTVEHLVPYLREGQLIVLESTTYPGTTRELVIPVLERSGLKSGVEILVAFSPEREDPGNPTHSTRSIPKVIGGDGAWALEAGCALYGSVVTATVPVSSPETAEAVKLTENIFRSVNIALVNELKLVFSAMGIDIWEVIDAAKSKPFGFMPFYPGPGLGGHCIPIDPFYLTWKAREFDMSTRFIELAGEVNTFMPRHVIAKVGEALNFRFAKSLNNSRILVLGLAYKKNVEDIRESPALRIIELLEAQGASVAFYDPYVSVIPVTREHVALSNRRGIQLSSGALQEFDAVLIVTDHDEVDYQAVVKSSRLVVDTRNATRAVEYHRDRIVKA